MNKTRRAELNRIINTLTDLKYDIDIVKGDEEEAMDNMPESLQESDRYSQMESAVDAMDEAYGYIEDAIDRLEDAME